MLHRQQRHSRCNKVTSLNSSYACNIDCALTCLTPILATLLHLFDRSASIRWAVAGGQRELRRPRALQSDRLLVRTNVRYLFHVEQFLEPRRVWALFGTFQRKLRGTWKAGYARLPAPKQVRTLELQIVPRGTNLRSRRALPGEGFHTREPHVFPAKSISSSALAANCTGFPLESLTAAPETLAAISASVLSLARLIRVQLATLEGSWRSHLCLARRLQIVPRGTILRSEAQNDEVPSFEDPDPGGPIRPKLEAAQQKRARLGRS